MGRLTHTVSGSIATVRSPAVAPIESLKVHFSPIQEGTGDPSPSNIRPITGWTGVTGCKSGKNLAHCIGWSAWGLNFISANRAIANTYGTTLNTTDFVGQDGAVVITQTDHPSSEDSSIQIQSYKNGYICIVPDNLKFGRAYNISFKVTDIISNPLNASISNFRICAPSGGQSNAVLVNDNKICFNNFIYSKNIDHPERMTIDIRICGMSCTISEFMACDVTDFNYDYEPYSGEIIPVTFPNFSANLFDPTDETFVNVSKSNDIYSNSDVDSRTYAQFEIQLYNDTTLLSTLSPHNFTGTGLMSFDFSINDPLCNLICFKHNGVTKDFRIRFPFTYGNGIYTISCNIISNDPTTVGGLQLSDISIKRGNKNVIDYANNTIYGGYVDLAIGNIVAEWKTLDLNNATFETNKNTTLSDIDRFIIVLSMDDYNEGVYTTPPDVYVKNFKPENIVYANQNQTPWVVCALTDSGYRKFYFYTPKDTYADVAAFKQAMADSPMFYKMANPQLIATLTPQELATFKGYSNFWSNAGDVDVTYQVVESSEMTKECQKIFAGNAPSIHTASGSVANFEMEPGLNRNLKSCKVGFLPVQEGSGDPFPPINQNGSIVGIDNTHNESELSSFKIHFSPIQSGSGDPSPTNIRPITGWTGVTGYKGGKSLVEFESDSLGPLSYDMNGTSNYYINTSEKDVKVKNKTVTYSAYIDATNCEEGTTCCVKIWTKNQDDTWGLVGYEGNAIQAGNSGRSIVTYAFDDYKEIMFGIRLKKGGVVSNPMVELGSTATTYEAYSAPTSYPVSWKSQGAVYGGYVDLVSGDVVAEYGSVDLGTLNWYLRDYNNNYWFYSEDIQQMKTISTTSELGNIISDRFLNVEAADIYHGRTGDNVIGQDSQVKRVRIKSDMYNNDDAAFKTAMDGVLLYYELETPIVVTTLTPTQIALATGKSSYWSNADAVTVETVGNVRPIHGWSGITEYAFGKNLLDVTNCSKIYGNGVSSAGLSSGVIVDSAVGGGNSDHVIFARDFPAGTYTLSCKYSGAGLSGTRILCTAPFDGGTYNQYYGGYFKDISNDVITITVEETFKVGLVLLSVYGAPTKEPGTIYDIQFEPGIVATEYVPYSSYESCSIEFPVQGKNLFDGQYAKGVVTGNSTSGYTWNNSGTNANSAIIKCDPNTTYTIKKHSSSNRFSIATCSHYPVLNDVLNLIVENANISQYTCTTGNDAEYLIVYVSTGTEQAEPDLMVEVGSTASTYEPYDNTILGGYVDLVTGEVWKTFGKSVIKGNAFSWWSNGSTVYSTSFLSNGSANSEGKRKPGSVIYSNMMTPIGGNIDPQRATDFSEIRYYGNDIRYPTYLFIANPGILPIADWRKMFNETYGENEYVVYELETPVLVTTLTPTQIQALKGTNNILSDANGIIEVKYWSH